MQQKIIIGLVLTLIIVIFIPIYWAMEPKRQEAALNRQKAEAVERGAGIYNSVCANCHGAQGEGIVGPALKGTRLDEDALTKIIARGISGTAMSAWSDEDGGPLKKHQINDLVNFIKNWDSAPQTLTPSDQTTPSVIKAAEADTDGSKLFADRCSSCHGTNREGTPGFAPPLTPESLATLSDEEIKNIILNGRSGTAMPAFKDMLNPEEINTILQLIKQRSP